MPPRTEDARDRPQVRLRAAVLGVVTALALVGAATAIIGHVAEWSRLQDALDAISPGWVVAAVAGLALAYAGYVTGYRGVVAIDDGPRLPVRVVARVVALGFGATMLGASVGGLAIDYWALRRAGSGTHEAVRRVLGFNTLQWLTLGAAATVAGAAALAGLASGIPAAMALAWVVVVPLCVAAGLWVSAPGRVPPPPGDGRPRGRDTGRGALRSAWDLARRGLEDAIGGLVYVRAVVRRPLRHPGAALGFPVYWTGQLAALASALEAFGAPIGLAALVLAFATGYAANALPLPAGGAGGVDAALTLTLHAVGVPLAPALLGTLLYRAVTFWLPILPALAVLPGVRGLDQRLRAVAG